MQKRTILSTALLAGALFLLTANIFAQKTSQTFDHLRGLKRALEEAAAPALTTAEEDQLKALAQAFHDSQTPPSGDTAGKAAHDAYVAAILAGDLAAANAQATILANLRTAASAARLQADAKLKVDLIALLKANGDQAGLLRQKFGDNGFLHILDSVAGGGFGGPRGGGGGFGGPGPGAGPGAGFRGK